MTFIWIAFILGNGADGGSILFGWSAGGDNFDLVSNRKREQIGSELHLYSYIYTYIHISI